MLGCRATDTLDTQIALSYSNSCQMATLVHFDSLYGLYGISSQTQDKQ